MGLSTLIYAAVAVTLLVVSRFFLKQPNQNNPLADDDKPTTLSSRGAYINYVLGTRRIGCFFGWADDEGATSIEEPVGGSSGKKGGFFGGGGGGQTQTIWFMRGWHILALGPATALHAIYENNEKVWEGPITRAGTPSGTLVEAEGVGSFRIYWGEIDQPVDPVLADVMGIPSGNPGLCHVVWDSKRLGAGGKTWGQLEYLLSCEFECVPSLDAPYILDDGVSRGVNPAHAIAQIVSGPAPYGAGVPVDEIGLEALQKVSNIAITEHLPVNLWIQDGDSLEKVLQGLLSDFGIMCVQHNKRLLFNIIREEENPIPSFSDDVILAPDSEINITTQVADSSRVIYTFKDENFSFRDNDIKFDDDAEAVDSGHYRQTEVALFSPTHIEPATKIASRRISESFGDEANLKVSACRGASYLLPGFRFDMPSVGTLVVLSVQEDTFSAAVQLECNPDTYALPPAVVVNEDGIVDSFERPAPANDLAASFVELPLALSGGVSRVVVFRIRAGAHISGATVWGSPNGSTYQSLGNQSPAASGGPLLTSLGLSSTEIVEDGPIIEALNADIQQVSDLSSDSDSWMSGSQILLINDEVIFLRNVTALSETAWQAGHTYALGDSIRPSGASTGLRYVCVDPGVSGGSQPTWPLDRLSRVDDGGVTWEARGFRYQLKGLIRGRFGTAIASHPVGKIAFISTQARLSTFSATFMQPGGDLCIKTQPFTFNSTVALSSALEICGSISGVGLEETFLSDENSQLLVTHTGERLVL